MSRHLLIGVSLITLGFVTACKTTEPGLDLASVRGAKIETSEQLLVAEGDWLLVEDEQAEDPMNMHSNARKQVNPNNRAARQYVPEQNVASAAGVKGGADDVNYRLIRMQKGLDREAPMTQMAAMDLEPEQNGGEEVFDSSMSELHRAKIIPIRKPSAPAQMVMAPAVESVNETVASVISNLAPAAGMESVANIQADDIQPVTSASTVNGIRFGDYPEKTRMVLDLSEDAPFKADMQNGQLVLDLPQSGWSGEMHKVLNNPLIKSYTASPSKNGGTRLSLELKRPVKVLGSSVLPPNSQYGHRIYLDIAAS